MNKYKPKEVTYNMIHQKYAEVSTFRGSTMDVSLTGKIKMKKITTNFLTTDNIDRLTSIISSNCCNNYFGAL